MFINFNNTLFLKFEVFKFMFVLLQTLQLTTWSETAAFSFDSISGL